MVKTDTPASKKKIMMLVSALCIPVFMWFINVFLLTSQTLEQNLTASLIAAILAGFLIFSIERNIIMANGSKMIMWIRIVLGVLIASLGSIAFDEVLFKKDIDQQMESNKNELVKQRMEAVSNTYSTQLASNNLRVKQLYNDWTIALKDASSESDGTGGSHIRGVSQIANLKIAIATQKQLEYSKAKAEDENLRKSIETKQIESQTKALTTFNENALLLRIQAMFELLKQDKWMIIVYSLVTSILFVLEFIVVVMKMNIPKSNYERKIELIERIGEERMKRILKTYPSHIDDVSLIPSLSSINDRMKKTGSTSIFN